MPQPSKTEPRVTILPDDDARLDAGVSEDVAMARAQERRILEAMKGQPTAPQGVSATLPRDESPLDELQRRYAPDTLEVTAQGKRKLKYRAVWIAPGIRDVNYRASLAMGRIPVEKPADEGGGLVRSPLGMILMRESMEIYNGRRGREQKIEQERWSTLNKMRSEKGADSNPVEGVTLEEARPLQPSTVTAAAAGG